MQKVIVSDASCLILLYKIGELDLLRKLYGQIIITPSVVEEYKKPLPQWIKISRKQLPFSQGLKIFLDKGESDSIALAATYDRCLLIIDELKGREVARSLGIEITGTLGIILAAKNKGLIPSVLSIIEKVQSTNFRVTDKLLQKILKEAGES